MRKVFRRGVTPQAIEGLFWMYDENGNKFLDEKEMNKLFWTRAPENMLESFKFFVDADLDNDNRVSKEEFANQASKIVNSRNQLPGFLKKSYSGPAGNRLH